LYYVIGLLARRRLGSLVVPPGNRRAANGRWAAVVSGRKSAGEEFRVAVGHDKRALRLIGVDLGGTKIAAGVMDERMQVLERSFGPTVVESQEACLADIFAHIDELLERVGGADAIGIGAASRVDFAAGRLVSSTNIPLSDVPLRGMLAERYGVPVAVDNDATVACVAEHLFGAGVGVNEMLLLTLGTGIGGGIVTNGRIYRGATGAAAELGHMAVDADGRPCQGGCRSRGCLEAYSSGYGLGLSAEEVAESRPDSALGRARAAGRRLDGELVAELVGQNDPDARQIVRAAGEMLGVGLANLTNIFNPELIVLGGGVAELGELLLGPARRVLVGRALLPQRDQVRVVQAHFGQEAGMVGAAALALTEGLSAR
jgi:glucokinase